MTILSLDGFLRRDGSKSKKVLKEMTRRRGKRDIKIVFNFCGNTDDSPARVRFTLKGRNGREFEIAIEKIEYMVDIISMRLKTLSHIIDEVEYLYDENNHRWFPSISKADHREQKVTEVSYSEKYSDLDSRPF